MGGRVRGNDEEHEGVGEGMEVELPGKTRAGRGICSG